jgi:hypothetical protein
MTSEPTKSEPKTTLGVPHGDYVKIVAGALVGLLFGIVSMLIANWWTSKAPYLRYTPADTVIFQGDKNRFGLVNCVVANDGSKEAEDVELFVDLADSPIDEVKVTPDSFQPDVKYENEPVVDPKKPIASPPKKGNRLRVTVKSLNPEESFQVLAMVKNPEKFPVRPAFTVRGKGVRGQMAVKPQYFEGTVVFVLCVTALSVSVYELVVSFRKQVLGRGN